MNKNTRLDALLVSPPTTYTEHLLQNRTATHDNLKKIQYDVPTGAIHLASTIKSAGGGAKVIELDSCAEQEKNYLQRLADEIEINDPRFLGISCMFNIQIPPTNSILEMVQESFPKLKTVVGGNAATYYPELVKNENIIKKKGEKEFLRMVLGKDVKDYVVDWSLFQASLPISRYQFFPMYRIGCNFNCGFCSSQNYYGSPKRKSKESFRTELKTLHEKGVREVCIGDETFYFESDLLEDFPGMRFIAETRADVVQGISKINIEECREQGLEEVLIGTESGSDRILELMNKKQNVKGIISALEKLKSTGISTDTLWIIGYPGSTLKEDLKTLRLVEFLYEEGLQDQTFPHIYRPFRGTPSFSSKEVQIIEDDFSKWNFTGEKSFPVHNLVDSQGKVKYSAKEMSELFKELIKLKKKYEK